MSDTIEQIDTTLDIDMDIKPQCEHPDHHPGGRFHHAGDAKYLVRQLAVCHTISITALICQTFWDRVGSVGCQCHCGKLLMRDEIFILIETL